MNDRAASYLSLFGSASTLICCAIPALLVSIGAGATLAGLVSRFPQLVWLSAHSAWIFSGAAILLALGGYAQWRARQLPCPLDSQKAKACMKARRLSLWLFIFSSGIFVTAFSLSFLIPWLFF